MNNTPQLQLSIITLYLHQQTKQELAMTKLENIEYQLSEIDSELDTIGSKISMLLAEQKKLENDKDDFLYVLEVEKIKEGIK